MLCVYKPPAQYPSTCPDDTEREYRTILYSTLFSRLGSFGPTYIRGRGRPTTNSKGATSELVQHRLANDNDYINCRFQEPDVDFPVHHCHPRCGEAT